MKCPKCKFDNLEGAKFCNACGNRLELICPYCGKMNPIGSKFCNECGHNLQKTKYGSSVDYDQPHTYTPKYLADKILTTRASLEGERKIVTVLFCDVANYTSISENLDPENVHQIMDGCFKIMMDEIHKYEGTINQFTGDGVMAIFGAPLAHEDHARRACYAALSIQKAIQSYSRGVSNRYGIDFSMRIGLNSGSVVVGSIGDDLRMDYTAVGDTTNLAARMESLAKPKTINVSGNTYKIAKDYFKFGPVRTIKVKGKKQLQKIYELLKESEIGTRIEAAAIKGLTRFVGRKNSMAALMDAYSKAKSGSGQVVGIVGAAGLGKSRMLLEFKNRLPPKEITYLEGRCLNYGDSIAYLPILDVLRGYFQIQENEKEFIIDKKMIDKIAQLDEKLKSSLPVFRDLLSLEPDDEEYCGLKPRQKRDKMFEAIRDILIRESQNKTTVVAIDDLQWIDKTSEALIDYLIGWVSRARLLVILLYRPEYNHQWGNKSYYNRIGLNHLTSKSSTDLIQAILESGRTVPELRELILSRAEGNPLYMEEFTQALLENGSIQEKDNQYVLARKISDIDTPVTIHGIIASRIDSLDDNLKRTIQEASVIGREFAFRILQKITEMKEEINSYLFKLQAFEFIYEKNIFPELEYIFKHALTQEVAYNSLLIQKRKEAHEKVGRAIEVIYKERLEEFYEMLAHHYSKSDNVEKAYQYLKLSGKKATQSHSNWEALLFYREAIDVLTHMPLTDSIKEEGLQVRILLTMPAMFLSYPEDSIDVLRDGVKLARDLGDVRSLAKLDGTLSHAYAIKGESNLAIEHAEKCYLGASRIRDLDLMAPVARDLTSAYMFAGELLKAVPIFSKVIPLIEKANKRSESFGRPASVYTFLCGLAGFILGFLGSFNEAEDLCEKALANALQNNDIYELAYSEFSYGIVTMQRGDGRSTVEHLRKCINYLEKSQMTTLMDPALAILGLGYIYQGDLDNAQKFADRAMVAACQQEAASANAILTQSISAEVYIEAGNLEKAHSCATKAILISEERKTGAWEGTTLVVLGSVLAQIGEERNDEAIECIERALIILTQYSLKPWLARGLLTIGEIYAHSGQKKKALENLRRASKMFQEMEIDYWLERTKICLEKISNLTTC